MTTTIERITAIIDEATADERAKVLDLERRLSNAYRDITELKQHNAGDVYPEPPQDIADLAAAHDALARRWKEQHDIDAQRLERLGALVDTAREMIRERDGIVDRRDCRISGMIEELRRRDVIVTDLNKQLDDAHVENARLVLKIAEVEAREERNIVDMQATIRTLNARTVQPAPTVGAPFDETLPSTIGKGLGPWVIVKDRDDCSDIDVGSLPSTPVHWVLGKTPVHGRECWRQSVRNPNVRVFWTLSDASDAILNVIPRFPTARIMQALNARDIEDQTTNG